MIKRIKTLQGCGIFRNFKWGDLPEFAKFNLIYGQNWTGKTTLSKVLQCLELHKTPTGKVHISTDKHDVREADFLNSEVPIRVFNDDFVKNNVFSMEGKDIPPIIILGGGDKKKQNQLQSKRAELTKVKIIYGDNVDKARTAKNKLDQHCRICAKNIKKILGGYGDGNTYGGYDARRYRRRAEEMLNSGDADAYIQDGTQKDLYVLIKDSAKQEISEPKYPKPDLVALRDQVVDHLSRKVTAETIPSLRDDPGKAEWVWRGIRLYDSHADACPFCGQQVPMQRKLDLLRHFNSEYESIMESLDKLSARIDIEMAAYLSELQAPGCEMIYEHLFDEYGAAKDKLDSYRTQVKEYLGTLATALKRKRQKPLDPIPLDGMSDPPSDSMTDDLIDVIHKHNNVCRDFSGVVAKARERVESMHVANTLDDFKNMLDNVIAARKAVAKSESRMTEIEAEVAELKRAVSNHGRSADDMNENLSKYLGHGDLQLDVLEHGYAIARRGNSNPFPSEGEKTAIALLYFLQSLKSEQFNIERGIVVLDDPVSSLDANALFAAYSFIRERTKNAGQLFVLTHNFTFFKEMRNWFKHVREPAQNARFYMLNSWKDKEDRYSEICKLDPLLKKYKSDYHYLFSRVWHGAHRPATLESNYALPNMARRLLETFLAFRRPESNGSLRSKMACIDWDEMRKRHILEFVNAHSHNEAISEQEHNIEILSEAPNVLRDLLEFIRDMDKDHYSRMEAIVER